MELFTVIVLAIDVALIVAIAIRAKSGERPPYEHKAPEQSRATRD